MPVEFASISATSIAIDARRALVSVAPTSSVPLVGSTVALPDDLFVGPFDLSPVSISVDDATTALATALISGEGILEALGSLAAALRVSNHSSLVSAQASVEPGGTRLSRVNIQSEGRRLLEAINSLVDSAGFRGANFISSDARRIQIQTTRYGGSVVVTPQPLDTRGLGLGAPDIFGKLSDFSALSDIDVQTVLAAVGNAIVLAGNRLQNLQVLERGLGFNTAALQEFARVLSQGRSNVLPPGSAVNLIG